MNQTVCQGLVYYQVPHWASTGLLAHGFLTRQGGVSPPPFSTLNAGPLSRDRPENVAANLKRIASALCIPSETILCAKQVHGSSVVAITAPAPVRSVFSSENPLQCDGLITDLPRICLGVLTADCVPLLLFDPFRPAIAAVHAGWRGARHRIAEKALERMQSDYGTRPELLQAAIGPAIGVDCYLVGEDVVSALQGDDPESQRFTHPACPGRWKVDLAGLIRHQLMRGGMQSGHIHSSSLCTNCRRDLFFSARGEGEPTGRQLSLIGLFSRTSDGS